MLSLSILRLFLDSQFPKTSFLSQIHKSREFSSSENRDRIRSIYNKIAYDRNVVIILFIKIRTNDISLFDRISFKNVAMTKILYVCLSNIKKIQYKTQIEQIIRSFLDSKIFFNRWLSQFRVESAINAKLKLISQWSRTKQKTSYRSRFNSWQNERKTQNSSSSSLKLDTRLFKSDSSEKYHRQSSKNEERNYYRSDREKSRSESKWSDYYRFYRFDQNNRYLEENRRTERYKEKYRQELVIARSIYDSASLDQKILKRKTAQFFVSSSRSSWKNFIFASSSWRDFISLRSSQNKLWNRRNSRFFVSRSRSFWKDFVSERSKYDNDSRYCIRLLYLSENDLSDDDYSKRFLFFKKSFHHLFSWRTEFFRPEKLLWDRFFSERIKIDQNRSRLHIS
jgi:hypothetical protein